LIDATDQRIWEYALKHGTVLLTKDEDFANLSLRFQPAPIIVWLRFGNCRKALLVERLLRTMPRLGESIAAGLTLIEII